MTKFDCIINICFLNSGQIPTKSCPLMSDVANDDEDPLAPYATSQVLLTHQHLADHMNQQVIVSNLK